mgnify:FL=1
MKKILITGGTTFVSKYVASYFCEHGYEVFVLNRNSKKQVSGVTLIEGDRHNLGGKLKNLHFDVVADITAYNAQDITSLTDSLGSFDQYIMVSSSAVYPDDGTQPFAEECERKPNKFWRKYGTDKIEAENALLQKVPDAYILRPPYLYGAMNNVYREAFVFDCARLDRPFYLPGDSSMKLQFFHVKDLCRIIEKIIETTPAEHILNVGNEQPVSIKDWVSLCYKCLSKTPTFVEVDKKIEQRNYFCFYDYEYFLDVKKQKPLLPETITLEEGLKEAADWYFANEQEVRKKDYLKYIDENLQEKL